MISKHVPTAALLLLLSLLNGANGFHIVLAGGTGQIGRELSSKLVSDGHDVTILCRNAFLAAAPSRVSSDFGWLGKSFLEKYPGVKLRDWDGGDLLDIVGQDWIGWQDDTLAEADCIVNVCGGFTEQREMATERIVRESLRVNPTALQITVAPLDEELKMISNVAVGAKMKRLKLCEEMVSKNCMSYECIRLQANRVEEECDKIKNVIYARLS